MHQFKEPGLDKTSEYYIGDLLRQYEIQYAWAYQDPHGIHQAAFPLVEPSLSGSPMISFGRIRISPGMMAHLCTSGLQPGRQMQLL